MKVYYLTLADVLTIHSVSIKLHGGAAGIRDLGALESAIYRPQTGYYPDLIAEAAALFESLAVNHPFIDGNKRVAFAATDTFLRVNGFKIKADSAQIYKKMMDLFDTQSFRFEKLELWLRSVVISTN
jgi:death-on-curing protein